jgi:hypothetical protein
MAARNSADQVCTGRSAIFLPPEVRFSVSVRRHENSARRLPKNIGEHGAAQNSGCDNFSLAVPAEWVPPASLHICDWRDPTKVRERPEFFKLSADDIRYLRIAAEVIASDRPLTPERRLDLANAMLILLDKAEPILRDPA